MEALSKENVRLLLTIGFAACAKGKVGQARKLFQNLKIAYPEATPVIVGLAFSHIVVDDFAAGEKLLAEVIDKDEEQDALALLAFSKALQKKEDEVREIAAKILEEHTSAYNLTQQALNLINQ